MAFDFFRKISRAPTNPRATVRPREFDVADLYRGPVADAGEAQPAVTQLDEKLRQAMEAQKALYPKEYATPVHPTEGGGAMITESHSLIPEALYHAFATFGVLMSPDLPLSRRQHEMITTVVSVTNRCVY